MAASIANTQPGPTAVTSSPAIVGPATNATLRERLISAFACCNRSARTVSGTSPVEAGEKKASAGAEQRDQYDELPERARAR